MKISKEARQYAWYYNDFHCVPDREMREGWFSGKYDNHPQGGAIRLFAKFETKIREDERIAAEQRGMERAAVIAEGLSSPEQYHDIAAAIRNAKEANDG
jgi:hypothetical protein